jgi:hypothetical protein
MNWSFSKVNRLCVSCDSHNKHEVFPLTTSTSFTCKKDCVLYELKTNICIHYLQECGANPLSPRIDSLLSLFTLSSTLLLTFLASTLLKLRKREILLKLLAAIIRSQKLLEWLPWKFNT